jgi:hypothetical protein
MIVFGAWSGVEAALLVRRSRDRFPVVSLDFSVNYSFPPHHDPGVDSAPSENEYLEYFLAVKAAGCVKLTTLPTSCAECNENLRA